MHASGGTSALAMEQESKAPVTRSASAKKSKSNVFEPISNDNDVFVQSLCSCESKCKKVITERDDSISCDLCSKIFLLKCTSFRKEVFDVLKKHNYFEDVLWRCAMCKTSSKNENSNLYKTMSDLQLRMSRMEESLSRTLQKNNSSQNSVLQSMKSLKSNAVSKQKKGRCNHSSNYCGA